MMGEKLKTGIYMPAWMLGLLVTIILALFSWGIATSANSAEIKTRVSATEQTIIKLEAKDAKLDDEKADVILIRDIRIQLNRMEDKIDRHMSNTK